MLDFTEENWEEFSQKHPSAYYFILAKQNNNEYIRLNKELKSKHIKTDRKQWIENRLSDMESIQAEFKNLLIK